MGPNPSRRVLPMHPFLSIIHFHLWTKTCLGAACRPVFSSIKRGVSGATAEDMHLVMPERDSRSTQPRTATFRTRKFGDVFILRCNLPLQQNNKANASSATAGRRSQRSQKPSLHRHHQRPALGTIATRNCHWRELALHRCPSGRRLSWKWSQIDERWTEDGK